MAALGACVSWIWSSWELNALTDVLETCVLQMALSNSPTFHGPYSLQVLRASWEVQVVELSWSRDVLDAGHQSTPQDLCWTWKLWSPPSLRSIRIHRIFLLLLPVGDFSWKTSHGKSLSQQWHRAHRSTLPLFQEHLCTYQLKTNPNF